MLTAFKSLNKMVKLSATGIIMNIVMLVLIFVVFFVAVTQNSQYNQCFKNESFTCFNVQCPCDEPTEGPCFGNAKLEGPKENTWYCSGSGYTLVDKDGNRVK